LPDGLLVSLFGCRRGALAAGRGEGELLRCRVGQRQPEPDVPVAELERDLRLVPFPAVGERGSTVPAEGPLNLGAALVAADLCTGRVPTRHRQPPPLAGHG